MDSIESSPDLFSKIGPLPAWGWGALAVGGYMLYSHMHASNAVPASDTVDTAGDPTGYDSSGMLSSSPAYDVAIDPSSAGYDYATTLDGTYSGTVSGATVFNSNQQWAIYAIDALTKAGVSPATAASAITHYLAGSSLTQAEADAVNQAMVLAGPPPLPLPVNVIADTPTPVTPVPSPTPSAPDPTPVASSPAPAPTATTTASAPAAEAHITVKNKLTAKKVDASHVLLSWTSVPHATGYHVWKDGRRVDTVSASTLTYHTAALSKGYHSWWIQAFNSVSHLGGNTAGVWI